MATINDVKVAIETELIEQVYQLKRENADLKHRMALLEKQLEYKTKADWQIKHQDPGTNIFTCKASE